MGVESPPKCVNRELNSEISIRSQDSHFSESDGALPTFMLLWSAANCVRYVKRDTNDSLCTTSSILNFLLVISINLISPLIAWSLSLKPTIRA